MNKKVLLFTCLFSILTFMGTAQNSGVRIEVSVKAEGLTNSEATSIVPAVFEKLEANLTKYTDFTILNNSNEQDILNIQAKSEGNIYESSIELGQLHSATHELFTIVRKVDEQYTVSVRFTDLAKRNNKTFLSKPRASKSELYSVAGCAVDEITIEICNAFGAPLDSIKKHALLHGEGDLDSEEMNKLYDQEIANYEKRIAQAQKDIDTANISSDIDADIARAKYESDKALAEEKLRQAKANKKRIEAEAEARRNQEMLDESRSAEQKNRIATMEKEAAMKAAEARKMKIDNESILGQIKIIELKKKAVVDLFDKINKEEERIQKVALSDIETKKKQILNAPPKSIETMKDKKTLTKRAVENRNRLYRAARKEIFENSKKQLREINSTLASQRDGLLEEIVTEGNSLKERTVNTLGQDLIVSCSPYDGERYGWDLNITVKCDDVVLFQTKSFLPFKSLSGKDAETYFDEDFQGYSDDVDYYDSLLLRGSEYLLYSIKYKVTPADLDYPSMYNFNFYDFTFYETKTLDPATFTSTLSEVLVLDKNEIDKKMSITYDLKPYATYIVKYQGIKNSDDSSTLYGSTYSSNLTYQISYNATYPKPQNINCDRIAWGIYPHSQKTDDVTIDESRTKNINGLRCVRGSDNNYYYPFTYRKSYYGDNITTYFRMEYIRWYKVKEHYVDADGVDKGTLYRAQNVLDGKEFFNNDFRSNVSRDSSTYNNYAKSTIRAFINSYDGSSYGVEDFTSTGFAKLAFNPVALSIINDTVVDNSSRSTKESYDSYSGSNQYACENTTDKFFLLSYEELTTFYDYNSEYSDKYYYREDKLVKTTDFSRLKGVTYATEDYTWSEYDEYLHIYEDYNLHNKGAGLYFLRSPYPSSGKLVRRVDTRGYFYNDEAEYATDIAGVVPCFTVDPKYLDN